MTIGALIYPHIASSRRCWWRSFSSARPSDSRRGDGDGPQRIIFLGTPEVAALVLEELLQAVALPGSGLEIAAVVSRPSSRHWTKQEDQLANTADNTAATAAAASEGKPLSGKTRRASQSSNAPNWSRHSASAVERLALQYGIPQERILCPVTAKEPAFLESLRLLRPALAVTAAYGAMLPQDFLDIPRYGTVNIHPSLLPKYRGAAPVQRALQDGCRTTGVSLVFSELKCDAGPVLEQQEVAIPPDIQAPELSEQLFRRGAGMLLRQLPRLLSGDVTAADAARQDEAAATYAPKISKQEAYLDFRSPALEVHNHVRAMAGWPGSRASLLLEDRATGTRDPIELKVLRTLVAPGPPPHPGPAPTPAASHPPLPPGTSGQVLCTPAGELLVPCGDGNMLSIVEVGRRPGSGNSPTTSSTSQPAKGLTAKEFIAGLGRRRLFLPSRT